MKLSNHNNSSQKRHIWAENRFYCQMTKNNKLFFCEYKWKNIIFVKFHWNALLCPHVLLPNPQDVINTSLSQTCGLTLASAVFVFNLMLIDAEPRSLSLWWNITAVTPGTQIWGRDEGCSALSDIEGRPTTSLPPAVSSPDCRESDRSSPQQTMNSSDLLDPRERHIHYMIHY